MGALKITYTNAPMQRTSTSDAARSLGTPSRAREADKRGERGGRTRRPSLFHFGEPLGKSICIAEHGAAPTMTNIAFAFMPEYSIAYPDCGDRRTKHMA
jgi:hypothetical protein